MKRPALLLCFLVWFASLLTAYYIGSLRQADTAAAKAPRSERTAVAAPQPETAAPADSLESPAGSALHAFFDGEAIPLEDALREIPTLSGEATRELLGEAFALPKSDPNRSRVIRELLAQLAGTEPAAALELASQIESLRDSERARVAVLQVWGKTTPPPPWPGRAKPSPTNPRAPGGRSSAPSTGATPKTTPRPRSNKPSP